MLQMPGHYSTLVNQVFKLFFTCSDVIHQGFFIFNFFLLSYGKAKNNETFLELYQDESVDYVILEVHLF